MTTAKILAEARKNNPEPARLAMSAARECRNKRERIAYKVAEACERVALEDYAGARNIVRQAAHAGVELPKCIRSI